MIETVLLYVFVFVACWNALGAARMAFERDPEFRRQQAEQERMTLIDLNKPIWRAAAVVRVLFWIWILNYVAQAGLLS